METSARPIPLTVVVLTYNEEQNLPACLESLAGWTEEIIVLDSGSTDRTQEIAKQYDVRLVEHYFETHTKQWNWALCNLPISTEWVLGLDADQSVTPDLRGELVQLFNQEKGRLAAVDGFYVKRKHIFRGRWIRRGGLYPKYLLKLFRPDRAQMDEHDLVDHHFHVTGNVAKLRYDIIEQNRKDEDIAVWIDKHNRYAALHAREELIRRSNGGSWPIRPAFFGSPDQRILWLKQRWYRLPLYIRPTLYFFHRYFLRLGFLDGKQGFIFHFLHAFWYRLLVDVNLDELSERPGKGP